MRYRKSCGPVLEAPPDASHVVGAGWATSWWPKSTDSRTGGKSADSVCDGSGNAATTIDSGLSEAAVVSVAIPAAGSAAVATSALATEAFATTALAIAIACGSSASLALAAREAARSSIGTAWVFSVPAEPKPASQATIHPARTTVPHNADATVADRRGFMIPSPPKAPPEPCCTAKHATAWFFGSRYDRAMAQTADHQLFQRVLPECNVAPASNCCAFSDVACRGSFGPMRRMRPVRGEPAVVMS